MTVETPDAWKAENLPAEEQPRRYVGSGDIAAIVALYRPELAHLAKWANASDVWLRVVHGVKVPHKRAMSRGLREENPLRNVYRETIGECSDLPGLIQHPRFAWAGGSPDGLGPGVVVELKTHSVWNRSAWGDEPWSDHVPDKYSLQAQWLMGLTGLPKCHFLCGFGSDYVDPDTGEDAFAWSETMPYAVDFDPDLYGSMEAMAERFFNDHVQTRISPDCKPVANRREHKRILNGSSSKRGEDADEPSGLDGSESAHHEAGAGDGAGGAGGEEREE